MRKKAVPVLVVHPASPPQLRALADQVSGFHAEVIGRRLRRADLTAEQLQDVIDSLLAGLRAREVDGVIRL